MEQATKDERDKIIKSGAQNGMFGALIEKCAQMAAETNTIAEYGLALSQHMATFMAAFAEKDADELQRMIKQKADEERKSVPKTSVGVPVDVAMIFSMAAHNARGRDEHEH